MVMFLNLENIISIVIGLLYSGGGQGGGDTWMGKNNSNRNNETVLP